MLDSNDKVQKTGFEVLNYLFIFYCNKAKRQLLIE